METLITNKRAALARIAPANTNLEIDSAIRAVNAAFEAGNDFAQKALIAGQILNEKKAAMMAAQPNWNDRTKAADAQFSVWMTKCFGEKSHDTLYRWMRAATRVSTALDLSNVIDIAAETISSVLTLPESELSEKGREARQLFLNFTADKTISDCLRDVADGSSPDHRIARAANGKNARQTSGDARKDFPKFIASHLKEMTSLLHLAKHKNKPGRERNLAADQQTQICASFDGRMQKWPKWLLKTIHAAATRELKMNDEERYARD